MNRLIIYGGSFNPLTIGHSNVAIKVTNYMLNRYPNDKIILKFMPTKFDFYKEKTLISGSHRINMLKLFCLSMNTTISNLFQVSSFELTQPTALSTYESLNVLKKVYVDFKIYFLLGADSLIRFSEWENNKELANENTFIIVNRKGYDYSTCKNEILLNKHRHIFINNVYNQMVSSTKVRKSIKENKGDRILKKYISNSILDYIKINNLYT